MIKSLCVRKIHDPEAGATYSHEDVDGDLFTTKYIISIDEEVYQDLGSPEQITITIEPGDKLNGD